MTDTNHIEVLRRQMDNTENSEVRAALDAAITALSARASAGEGGDHPYRQLQKWWEDGEPIPTLTVPDWAIASAYRQAVSKIVGPYFRAPNALPWAADITVAADWAAQEWRKKHPDYALDPLALAEWLRIHHRCSEVKDWERLPPELLWIYESLQRLAKFESAAPQPAQAGASGGGVCDCIASRCLHEKTCASLTTPASPATEDGPDSFDCPHAHAARVCGCGFCRALNSDRYAFGAPQPAAPQPQEAPVQEPSNARKPDECANGCPPQQVCDYCQIATPPAHGDGEVWLPSAHDWLESANGVASREWMAGWDAARNRLHTLNTTRPTPEAQEARDGDTKRLDWLDGFTCASEYRINEYFGSAGRMRYVQIADRDGTFTAEAQSLREAIDAAMELDSIDAALALPAQGEGNNAHP